jgi:hypothetical protein
MSTCVVGSIVLLLFFVLIRRGVSLVQHMNLHCTQGAFLHSRWTLVFFWYLDWRCMLLHRCWVPEYECKPDGGIALQSKRFPF